MSVPAATPIPRWRQFSGVGLIRLYIGSLFACAALVWAGILFPWESVVDRELVPRLLVLAALAYATEAWVVHVHYRRQAHTLSLNEIVIVLGLFFLPPAGLLLAQLIGAPLALLINRRQRSVKFAFNMAQLVLTTGLAINIFQAVLGSAPLQSYRAWAAAMLSVSISAVIGVLLVAVVIGIAEREWSARDVIRTSLFSIVGTIAAGSVALVSVELINERPGAMVLLVVPTTLCGIAFRSYMRQRQESERVQFLYESMRKTQAASDPARAAHELLLSARHLLRAEYAELLLLSTDKPTAKRFVCDRGGDVVVRQAPLDDIERSALRAVLATGEGLLLPRHRPQHVLDGFLRKRALRDAIIVALEGEHRLLGLLVAGDRASDVATFEDEDVGLLETFAGHATVVLENNRLEQSLAEVTELKEQLHHQVLHDHLTGLPNRVAFAQAVQRALGRDTPGSSSTAVVFLDPDDFKAVNDTLGHAAGDELLVQVAERLKSALRPGDMPSRLAGDEFAAVLVHIGADGARRTAERILQSIERPYRIADQELVPRASLGIALATEGVDADELIRNADIAMYTAKGDEARSYVFYEPSFHARLRRRRELALELEGAAERGEIEAHFQPVVALADGSIHAFEALARWRHPNRGLMSAVQFIPVAEESGLIMDIGAEMLRSSCAQAGAWQDAAPAGRNIGLWINISPAEFGNEKLVEDLAVAITSARIDPQHVTVEVTESAVIRDAVQSTETLHRLRALGVSVSIDDFGTGYSSLSRLTELPIDMLKIPKPFVDRLAADVPDSAIVDAILQLASSLGLTTVAEGVETEEQAELLRQLGCGLVQGYLYGKAESAEDTLHLLRHGRPAESEIPTS